ncbi:MAG: O-antigen ligase family protein [Bdellovibrionaceae bacterium]|nr:O-antigen ligase family protein [Bdellovibrio sp.]
MCKKYLEFILYKLIGLFPLICLVESNSLLFPYITGKNFIFRVLVELLVGIWALLILVEPQYRPKKSWLTLSLLFFLMTLAVADLLGAHPFKSFWSNYSRMEGWITHLHLFLYYLVLTSFLKNKWQWQRWLKISFLVSALMAVYAFFQTQGLLPVVNIVRVDGTLGNSAYLAIYMILHLFIGLYLILIEPRRWLYYSYAAVCSLHLFTLFLTQTRGTFLALTISLLSIIIYFILAKRERVVAKKLFICIGIFLITAGVLITTFWVTADPANQAGSRLVSTAASGQSVQVRIMIWKAAWEAIRARPLLGWGQENFNFAGGVFPANMWNEPWPDRAHNIALDWWLSAGLLGCVAYFLIYSAAAQALWKPQSALAVNEKIIITAFFACGFINNLFIFDQIVTYILFFTMLAYVNHSQMPSTVQAKNYCSLSKKLIGIMTLLIVALTSAAVYRVNYVNWRACDNLRIALTPASMLRLGPNGKPEFLLGTILDENLIGNSEVREQIVLTAIKFADQKIDPAIKNILFELAKTEFGKEVSENPNSPYLNIVMGRLLGAYNEVQLAHQYFTSAEALAPANQDVLVEHAENFVRAKQFKPAAELYFKAYTLEQPPSEKVLMYYAVGLIYNEQYTEAAQVVKNLKDSHSIHAYDPHLINAYLNRKQMSQAEELYKLYVDAQPKR